MADSVLIKTVREQVVDQLRRDIFCGHYAEGKRLSEASLAKRFGVGRGPIREALLQLTHEGLLVSKPNCGVTVAGSPSDALQNVVLPIRRTLETYALENMYESLNEDDFQAWGEILMRLDYACRHSDLPGILNYDMAFHKAIMMRSGDADLLRIWQSLLGSIRNYFWTVIKQFDDLVDISIDHHNLLETFRAGDKEVSVRALEKHIW